ncbi:hypothetical protein DES53_10141 [Roseimicrobium gellanilyticum]|uniref:Uncharacterized protein n=1 Tax=Roseimicrobium gellanilyticum TaxID=748857 RepID=A0A366HUN4_9BACT|nr:hypothetical protein [Roseimicrobium gellanilyticum]RBP47244.1 hypothetical protein DES53_10141 [Roseimicrobium gellanilyticum]
MPFGRLSPIAQVTNRIEREIEKIASEASKEKVWVTHYGANDIHPRHLVYWICVRSDHEKDRLQRDVLLNTRLRELLTIHNYPVEGREEVHIGFESHETVDRESGGNWWVHWK